ncbi:462_t:CDS:2, partial [Scutellospora calospora]
RIVDIVMNKRKSLFFTGSGGCGKTYTLNYLIRKLYKEFGKDKIGVSSSTALSAMNIKDGMTLHKLFSIGIMDKPFKEIIYNILENDFIHVDRVAREIRGENEPFGGIQLVISGDFAQLRPVEGKYAFQSKLWDLAIEENILLKKIYRQTDEYFIRDGREPTRLFSTNKEVTICNMNKLNDIPGEMLKYVSVDWS